MKAIAKKMMTVLVVLVALFTSCQMPEDSESDYREDEVGKYVGCTNKYEGSKFVGCIYTYEGTFDNKDVQFLAVKATSGSFQAEEKKAEAETIAEYLTGGNVSKYTGPLCSFVKKYDMVGVVVGEKTIAALMAYQDIVLIER